MPTPENGSEKTPYLRDWNARLVYWFLRNSQVALLVFLMTIIGGVMALTSLRSEGFPSPKLNFAFISSTYIGASPEEVERSIVKPLEVAAQSVSGVTEVQSTSSNSFGLVNVTLDAGVDVNTTLGELRNKIQDVQLPKDAGKPEVVVPNFGGNNSYYALMGSSEDPAVYRAIGDELRLDLDGVKGVKDFKLLSPIQDQLLIKFDPIQMGAKGVTPLDIQNALQSANVTIPAGKVALEGRDASAVTIASLKSVDEVRDLAVKPGVLLKDIAFVDSSYKYDSLSTQVAYKDPSNGSATSSLKSALVYQLTYDDTVSVLDVAPQVEEVMEAQREKLQKDDVQLVVLSDVAESIRDQIHEITAGAIGEPIGDSPLSFLGYVLGGIWLIMLGMLLFVSWRAALISALALPLSLLMTFLALWVQGVSLNTLTLFSMVLVLGLIVDPAIVVLEAIQRELDLGKRGREAVLAAVNSIGSGVFYAVLTSIIVFVPFGVVSGIFGEIIKYIPITVIPALVASYLVPVLFLTFLAQKFLKPSREFIDDEAIKNLWKVSQGVIKLNTSILAPGRAKAFMRFVIILVGVVAPLAIAGTLFSTGKVVPVQFSAPDDTTDLAVTVEFPSNLPEQSKRELVQEVEQKMADNPAIFTYFVQQQTDKSLIFLTRLVDRSLRSADAPDIAVNLEKELDTLENPDKGIYLGAKASGIGTPEADFPVAVNIYGDSLENLKNAAIKTGQILREQPNVTRVEDGFSTSSNPQIEIVLDRAKLSTYGIPAVQVAGAMAGVLGETTVTKYEEERDGAVRTVEVLLTNWDKPSSVEAVGSTVIGASAQGPLMLKDVAAVREVQGVGGINRLNGSRYVTVQAKVKDALKDAAAPQKAVRDFWTSDKLAEYGLRSDALENKGNTDQFVKSFSELFMALGISIVMLYVVLVFFLKSFSQPFIILFAVPLTFIGVFPALTLVGGQFGFLEILGIITLSGIVVNVGIFLFDLANQKRAEGMPTAQAIAEATGIRFRPIFLTKVTTLAGLLPLIILSPFWRSLAVVVTSGVLVSGFLTLFTAPILYVWFISFKERIATGWKRRVA